MRWRTLARLESGKAGGNRRVTLFDEANRRHFTLPYSAIVTALSSGTGTDAAATAKPAPPPEIASRADFRVGTRVSFTDRNLQHRIGLIVRINQRTATLDCDGQNWRLGSACSALSLIPDCGRRQ